MAKYPMSSVNAEAERFATTIHTSWGVGDSALQNGCLIFVSVLDRVVHISYGKSIQGRISSVDNKRIIDHMKPLLQQQDYGSAILIAIAEINVFVTREPTHDFLQQKRKDKRHFVARKVAPWILASIFTFLTAIYLYSNYKERRIKHARAAVRRVMVDVQLSRDGGMELTRQMTSAFVCPMCLEELLSPNDCDKQNAEGGLGGGVEGDLDGVYDNTEEEADGMAGTSDVYIHDPRIEQARGTGVREDAEDPSDATDKASTYLRPRRVSGRSARSATQAKTPRNQSHPLVGREIEVIAVDTSLNRDSYKYSSQPLRIACGHVFCGCCLQLHMHSKTVHHDECPICGRSIDGDGSAHEDDMTGRKTDGDGRLPEATVTGKLTDAPLSQYQRQIVSYQAQRLCSLYRGVLPDTLQRDVDSSLEQLGTAKAVVSALSVHFNTLSETVREIEARRRHIDGNVNSGPRAPTSAKKDS